MAGLRPGRGRAAARASGPSGCASSSRALDAACAVRRRDGAARAVPRRGASTARRMLEAELEFVDRRSPTRIRTDELGGTDGWRRDPRAARRGHHLRGDRSPTRSATSGRRPRSHRAHPQTVRRQNPRPVRQHRPGARHPSRTDMAVRTRGATRTIGAAARLPIHARSPHDAPHLDGRCRGRRARQDAIPAAAATAVRALDGLSSTSRAGSVFGAARPQRRRQVHHRQDPHHARPAPTRGTRARSPGIDVAARPRRGCAARSGWSPRRPSQRPDGDRPREPRAGRADPGHDARGRARPRAASCWSASSSPTPPTGSPRRYSGGMARKLDVAIGLVHRPRVLFLDEPTTGLDPEARAEMWAEIGRLAGDERMTVLLTTHYLDEADRLADRLAIVDRGRIVVEGTPGRAEERAARRHACRSSSTRRRARPRGALLDALAGPREVAARRRQPARPAPRTARAPSRPCSPRWRTAGIAVASVDRRAAVARRRLPALRRPQLRGGGMTAMRTLRHSAYLTAPLAARAAGASRSFAAITLIQPIIWLLLFGQLFQAVVEIPGFARLRLVPRVHHPRRDRHDGAVLQRLGGHGLHRGHEPRRDGPPARLARAARGDDGRHARLPGASRPSSRR